MCVQLLARAFEIGVINGTSSLGRFSNSPFVTPGQKDFAQSIADFAARSLHGSLVIFKENRMSSMLRRSSNPEGHPCLLALGGFYDNDAESLLDCLWDDRKAFMVLCNRVEMSGWSILLTVIWEQIRYFEK